jgi:ribosomal protein S18 acetylase RimI-like enzyme
LDTQLFDEIDDIKIRYADTDDIHRLHDLYQQLIPDRDPDAVDMKETLKNILQHLKSVSIIVAEHKDDIVATCQIIVYDNLIRTPQKKAVVDSVVVDLPFRNKGVGTRMISWAVEELKRRDVAIIYVSFAESRDIAPKLYKKAGFKPFGSTFYIACDDE